MPVVGAERNIEVIAEHVFRFQPLVGAGVDGAQEAELIEELLRGHRHRWPVLACAAWKRAKQANAWAPNTGLECKAPCGLQTRHALGGDHSVFARGIVLCGGNLDHRPAIPE